MKNKKLYISMSILTIAFLIFMYVLKFWFPQEFMMYIQNEQLVKIGTFIDNHEWLYYICCGITAFITYWLYCCACSGRLWLKWYELLEIVIVIVLCRVVNLYDTNIATIISWCSFVFLPALMGGELKRCAIIFTIHSISQGLSIGIRNLPMYLTNTNFVTICFMTFECYLWLLLFYIIFNIKKENKNMGLACPPVYGKSKFYEKKKAKSEKKIAKLQEVVKVCDEQLAKENK